MGRKLLLAAGGAAVAAALAAIGAVSVSAAAAAAGTGAAPTTRFVSKQYRYSIAFPGSSSDWTATFALIDWSTDTIEPGSPAFDTYLDSRTGRRFAVAARRPPTGETLAKWTAFTVGTVSSDCTKPKAFSNSTLSGAPARVFTWTCPNEFSVIAIAALHGSLGYFMFVPSPLGLASASNENAFEVARRAFQFTK